MMFFEPPHLAISEKPIHSWKIPINTSKNDRVTLPFPRYRHLWEISFASNFIALLPSKFDSLAPFWWDSQTQLHVSTREHGQRKRYKSSKQQLHTLSLSPSEVTPKTTIWFSRDGSEHKRLSYFSMFPLSLFGHLTVTYCQICFKPISKV